jgi:hypothetical protein
MVMIIILIETIEKISSPTHSNYPNPKKMVLFTVAGRWEKKISNWPGHISQTTSLIPHPVTAPLIIMIKS